jgi:hypothetical protein
MIAMNEDMDVKSTPDVKCPPHRPVHNVTCASAAHDPVERPAHYTRGRIEVIEFIEDQGFGYHLGNAIKYISRAGHKQDALEDLRKAKWYIERMIERLRGEV